MITADEDCGLGEKMRKRERVGKRDDKCFIIYQNPIRGIATYTTAAVFLDRMGFVC